MMLVIEVYYIYFVNLQWLLIQLLIIVIATFVVVILFIDVMDAFQFVPLAHLIKEICLQSFKHKTNEYLELPW